MMTSSFNKLLNVCKERALKMTPQRKWVLECLHAAAEPLTAYELLDVYRKAHDIGEAMTIYRALAYLEAAHLVHKIHSQNKYKLCDISHTDSNVQLFLCNNCHGTTELHVGELPKILEKTAKANGFIIQQSTLELSGVCNKCRKKPSASSKVKASLSLES